MVKRRLSATKNSSLNLLLLISSITLVLILAEFTLRLFFFKKQFVETCPPNYYTIDDYSGYDISTNFPPQIFTFGNLKHKIWSNELGCFDYAYRGEDYILLVGDSFSWGFAPFEYKFGTLLEDYLDYRVLKCGVSGYGTKQEALKIKKIIEKSGDSPKLIIAGYYLGNDFEDDYLFPNATVMGGDLVDKNKIVNYSTWEKEFISDEELRQNIRNWQQFGRPYNPYLISLKEKIYNSLRDIHILRVIAFRIGWTSFLGIPNHSVFYQIEKYPYLKKAWADHLDNLKKIKEISDRNGAKLMIILIPPKERVYNSLKFSWKAWKEEVDFVKLNKRLQDYFARENIDYLDLTPCFKRYAKQTSKRFFGSEKDLYWRYDAHWNIKGNRLVALLISKFILERNLIDIVNKENIKKRINEELVGLGKQ